MLVAVFILGALLLLFLKVRASVNKRNIEAPEPTVMIQTPPQAIAESSQSGEMKMSDTTAVQTANPPAGISAPTVTQLPLIVEKKPVKIFFGFNRSAIDRNVYCIFDLIDERVNKLAGGKFRIMVEGNADSIGPSWYNQNLSRVRAERVADSLSRRLGISLDEIEIVANGSARPTSSNATPQGRADNRRTEVRISY